MKRVIVLTDDRIGETMAGPAIRAWEIAQQISTITEVTLASTQPISRTDSRVTLISLKPQEIHRVVESHDVLIIGGLMLAQNPSLIKIDKPIVLDIYDPLLFEELGSCKGALEEFRYQQHHEMLAKQLKRADFMICASDRQRDYWIGRLCALGRLTPQAYQEDPSFRNLIDCVPFGISSTPPVPSQPRLRGSWVGEKDCLFLWGGGLWDWLDPLTPIRAAALLKDKHPSLKLVFLSGRSPNPGTPVMPMVKQAHDLAQSLEVLGKNVFFYDQWVPYAERGSLLLEADAGFVGHPDWIETRYAFRTRVLDYLWAGIPIISTRGDAISEWVERNEWGVGCGFLNVADWEKAFLAMLDPTFRLACQERIKAARDQFCWEKAVAPLLRYLESPRRGQPAFKNRLWHQEPWATLIKTTLSVMDEGPTVALQRIRNVLGRHV